MSARATVLLGVTFVVLLAAFVFTGERERRIERLAFEAKTLFAFSPSDITTLSIQQAGSEPVEAVRGADGGWDFAGAHRAIEPNDALWDQLAEVMTVARNERPIPGAEDALESFELDPPRLTVVVGTKQGVAHQIDFGGLDPTQRHRYHRMADEGVFLSSADWFSIMNRTLAELRDRRLFRNLADGLAKFEYQRYLVASDEQAEVSDEIQQRMAGIDETYAKNEAGQWRLVAPVDAPARPDELEALARVLPSLGGRAYIDAPDNLADYGLDAPFARMTVYGPDGAGETLLLGGIDAGDASSGEAGLYVKRPEARGVIVVDARLFSLLPGEPEAFRERRLFSREALGLTSLAYRDGTNTFTLDNGERGWQLRGVDAGDTDQFAVSMYIQQLKRIEGMSFPENGGDDAFDSPRIVLEFTFEEGAPSRIDVGAPVPGSDPITFYARQDFGSITTISFEDFQRLQATPFDFRQKALLRFDSNTVTGIDLTLDGERFVFDRANGRWSVTQPRDTRLPAQSEIAALLEAVANAQARGIADPPPAADVQGMNSPVLEIALHVAGDEAQSLGPIRVGNLKTESSRERFATVGGRPTVYFVDQSLLDVARTMVGSLQRQP